MDWYGAPWIQLQRTPVLSNRHLQIDEIRCELPDSSTRDFYVKVQPDAVAVLAITADSEVLVTRQFRPGPQTWLTELPGGFIDSGEDPVAAAHRELLEETGHRGEMRLVGDYFLDAYSTMRRYCFLATNCVRVNNAAVDESEVDTVDHISIMQVREFASSGQMTDSAAVYMGLDALTVRE